MDGPTPDPVGGPGLVLLLLGVLVVVAGLLLGGMAATAGVRALRRRLRG